LPDESSWTIPRRVIQRLGDLARLAKQELLIRVHVAFPLRSVTLANQRVHGRFQLGDAAIPLLESPGKTLKHLMTRRQVVGERKSGGVLVGRHEGFLLRPIPVDCVQDKPSRQIALPLFERFFMIF
jgi:hypothetical protein